jgi:hypothetical protein
LCGNSIVDRNYIIPARSNYQHQQHGQYSRDAQKEGGQQRVGGNREAYGKKVAQYSDNPQGKSAGKGGKENAPEHFSGAGVAYKENNARAKKQCGKPKARIHGQISPSVKYIPKGIKIEREVPAERRLALKIIDREGLSAKNRHDIGQRHQKYYQQAARKKGETRLLGQDELGGQRTERPAQHRAYKRGGNADGVWIGGREGMDGIVRHLASKNTRGHAKKGQRKLCELFFAGAGAHKGSHQQNHDNGYAFSYQSGCASF